MTGGGGYLFTLLTCWMIIATVVCRQKECSDAPSWITNGVSPLYQRKGNITLLALMNFSSHLCLEQTLRMDTLLQDLQDYGMHDLAFIVINSKLPSSSTMFNKIKKKISFPVYQEQDDEQIWDIMDGETNDMFIYDRCSRLTYFVPFPLSDLRNKQTVVRAAILSTYFRSPCGSVCNNHHVTNDIHDIIGEGMMNEYESQEVIQSNNTDLLENIEGDFRQFENETDHNDNEISPDDYNFDSDDSLNNITTKNVSIEGTSYKENQKATIQKPSSVQKNLLAIFMEYFWKDDMPSKDTLKNSIKVQANNISKEETVEMSLKETSIDNVEKETSAEMEENSDNNLLITPSEKNNKILPNARDVCLGIDENLCLEWSKSKLLNAQKCCLLATQDDADRQGKGCKNLGRKRCKKIQPILKCCLKTEIQQSPKEQIRGSM